MGIHNELYVLRPLPILKILQVTNECLILEIAILSKIVDIRRIGEALNKLQLEKKPLATIIRILVRILR